MSLCQSCSSLSVSSPVSLLNDNRNDHLFSHLSVGTAVTYPDCQVAGAVVPSLMGEHVRIMQKEVFRCACAGLVPLGVKCACTCAGDGEVSSCVKNVSLENCLVGRRMERE